MGLMYQAVIFAFILFIYYACIVNLFFLNRAIVFNGPILTAIHGIYLAIFHVMLVLIIYCYLASVIKNPGQPPKFWVSSLGLLHRLAGREEKTVLRDLQQFQARTVPSLLDLRPVRLGHGPSLPLAQ